MDHQEVGHRHRPACLFIPGGGTSGSGKYRGAVLCIFCHEEVPDLRKEALSELRARGVHPTLLKSIEAAIR